MISLLLLVPGKNLTEVGLDIPHLDKLIHFVMFSGLSFLFLSYWNKRKKIVNRKIKMTVIISFSIFGVLIEVVQEVFISGRYFDVWDIVANVIGVIVGVILRGTCNSI